MPVPPAPTITSILTEALTRAGHPSPATDLLTRAEDEWFEETKQAIASFPGADWRLLEDSQPIITTAYVQEYTLPSPLFGVRQVWFYDGDERGTAQAGTSTSITLAASATTNVDAVRGYKIFLTGGTGAPQVNRVTAYNGSTKVATVASAWTTTPDATTTYLIANRVEQELSGPDPGLPSSGQARGNRIRQWELYERTLRLYPLPDAAYGLEVRGPVDISLVDETDPRFTQLLREWRPALILGVMVRVFQNDDDFLNADRYQARFEEMVQRLLIRDRKQARRPWGSGLRSPGGIPLRRTI